jgi:hypothetical protein
MTMNNSSSKLSILSAAKAALAEAVSAFLAGYNHAAVTEINGYAAAEAAVEAKANKWQ